MAHVPRGRREGCEDNEKDRSAEWEEGNESINQEINQPYSQLILKEQQIKCFLCFRCLNQFTDQ